MVGSAQKRRKMRPENSIAKTRAEKNNKRPKLKNREDQDNSTDTVNPVKPKPQPTKNTIKRKRKINSKQIPAAKVYSSASDSDETDEDVNKAKLKIKRNHQKINAPTTVEEEPLSASDSDETDQERRTPIPAPIEPIVISDNSSDSSDSEYNTPPVEFIEIESSAASPEAHSPSSDHEMQIDSTSESQPSQTPEMEENANRAVRNIKSRKAHTTEYIEDSDNPESGESGESSESEKETTASAIRPVAANNRLSLDRISFRRKHSFDASKPTAFNLRQRFNDLFIPDVSGDNFISDSDSDSSDSGDDYENKDYPPWHRTLSYNKHPERGEWPKTRRFGYSDKLKLEKRIKKICRRENISFDTAREIFSNHKKGQLRFFQKIGKVFPDMPLYRLTKVCKETYHVKRNNSPWTEEEIAQLEELVKVYGRNAEKISTMMNRSPKNINDFFFSRFQKTATASKKWTKEEDELLAKAIATERKKNPERISYRNIEPLFKGQRSQLQIYGRAGHIGHRVQADGTLLENRKATPEEELQYLQKLMDQANEHNLTEESQLNLKKDRGFVAQSFYLRRRNKIDGFETMQVKEILKELIKRQKLIIKKKSSTGKKGKGN